MLNPEEVHGLAPEEQAHWVREGMVEWATKRIMGVDFNLQDLAALPDRDIFCHHFPDNVHLFYIKGQPALQVEGPYIQNGWCTFFRVSGFRELPEEVKKRRGIA